MVRYIYQKKSHHGNSGFFKTPDKIRWHIWRAVCFKFRCRIFHSMGNEEMIYRNVYRVNLCRCEPFDGEGVMGTIRYEAHWYQNWYPD